MVKEVGGVSRLWLWEGVKFGVLEGLDGSGKGTQAKLLRQSLERLGVRALFYSEHTRDGAAGALIEEVVNRRRSMDPVALQYVFIADRVDLRARTVNAVREMKARGEGVGVVINDRHWWSTVAYGGTDRLRRQNLLEANVAAVGQPDWTFLIDVTPEEAMRRINNGRAAGTIFEKLEKLGRVRENYLWLAGKSDRCTVIDGSRDESVVAEELQREVVARLIG